MFYWQSLKNTKSINRFHDVSNKVKGTTLIEIHVQKHECRKIRVWLQAAPLFGKTQLLKRTRQPTTASNVYVIYEKSLFLIYETHVFHNAFGMSLFKTYVFYGCVWITTTLFAKHRKTRDLWKIHKVFPKNETQRKLVFYRIFVGQLFKYAVFYECSLCFIFWKNLMDFPNLLCFTMFCKWSSSDSNASVKYVCFEQRPVERIVKYVCFKDEKHWFVVIYISFWRWGLLTSTFSKLIFDEKCCCLKTNTSFTAFTFLPIDFVQSRPFKFIGYSWNILIIHVLFSMSRTQQSIGFVAEHQVWNRT